MPDSSALVIGADLSGQPIAQSLRLANRHGLVAGATGTGKTVALQRLAEQFSDAGVAVFAADIKGDLCGLGAAGNPQGKIAERIAGMPWLNYQPKAYPVTLWDIQGKTGHPLRTTLSEMGPLLLGSLLELTDSQQSALYAAFKVADREGLLLLDLKDLKALLNHLRDNPQVLGDDAALMTTGSSQALLRRLATLEQQGAEALFGEPALQLDDILQPASDGRGQIHLLDASRLVHEAPKVYATFLLWLLAELFEQLPEAGDLDKPKLVFFFDEAHLLFDGAPAALVDKVEQVVRLIRSKGVGVFFVTQNPLDVPEKILGQLGNRVQHALRAFTPRDQKAVLSAAQTMRANPKFNAAEVITELGVGEALVSFLDEKGRPNIVERAFIFPPASRIGPLTEAERRGNIEASPLLATYGETVDRESAYEILRGQPAAAKKTGPGAIPAPAAPGAPARPASAQRPQPAGAPEAAPAESDGGLFGSLGSIFGGSTGPRGGRREGVIEAAAKSAARGVAGTVGRELGRQILRGVLGSILGGRR